MSKIVLDAELKAKLNGLNEPMEFVEADGRTRGHYVPDHLYKKLLYAWANAQVTDEELEEARRDEGRSLQEIWKRLGNA